MLWVGEWRMELNFGGVGTFLGNIFFIYIIYDKIFTIYRSYWGIHGYFKIIRGKYTANLAIEEDCHWAVPEDTWSDDQRN